MKANEIKVPLSNTYIPSNKNKKRRENCINCMEESVTNESNQTNKIYIINDDDSEAGRNGVDA